VIKLNDSCPFKTIFYCIELQMSDASQMGRGVKTTRTFRRGDFVAEYAGELLPRELGLERDRQYGHDGLVGGYSVFFSYKNKGYG